MRHALFGLLSLLVGFLAMPGGVFGQVPTLDPAQTVNLATGEMGFSLPLGVVRGVSGHSFPINLNYQAGIRWDQDASEVGLGFSYGPGAITRKVVFVADNNKGNTPDNQTRFQCTSPQNCILTGWIVWFDLVVGIVGIVISTVAAALTDGIGLGGVVAVLNWANVGLSTASSVVHSVCIGSPDFKAGGYHLPSYDYVHLSGNGFFQGGEGQDRPDVYLVSTPYIQGELVWVGPADPASGHFVFKQSGGSAQKGKETIKVEYDRVNEVFTITLSDGTVLKFEETDRCTSHYLSGGQRSDDDFDCTWSVQMATNELAVNSWLLTKVLYNDFVDVNANGPDKSDKGSWVTFEYEAPDRCMDYQVGVRFQESPWSWGSTELGNVFSPQVRMCTLKRIRTPIEYADFNYTYDRKDTWWFINHTDCAEQRDLPVLHDIAIHGPNDALRSDIVFTTAYELRPNSYFVAGVQPLTAALTLKAVQIRDPIGKALPPVTFKYVALNPQKLHPPFSFGATVYEWKDVWGYYCPNPANGNDFNATGLKSRAVYTGDGVEKPYAAAWSLEQVFLPSGMSIRWEYEANRYKSANGQAVSSAPDGQPAQPRYGGGIRVKRIVVNDGMGHENEKRCFYTDAANSFVETSLNSSGHATVEPFDNILDQASDPRPTKARGGLYTACKVAYEMVKVVDGYQPNADPTQDGTTPNGYSVYEFVTSKDHPNGGMYGEYDYSWERGLLSSVTQYNSAGKEIAKTRQVHEPIEQTAYFDETPVNVFSFPFEVKQRTYGWMKPTQTIQTQDKVPVTKAFKFAPDFTASQDRTSASFVDIAKFEPWTSWAPTICRPDWPSGCFAITKNFSDVNSDCYAMVTWCAQNGATLTIGKDFAIEPSGGKDKIWSSTIALYSWQPWPVTGGVNVVGVASWAMDGDNNKNDLLIVSAGLANTQTNPPRAHLYCRVLHDVTLAVDAANNHVINYLGKGSPDTYTNYYLGYAELQPGNEIASCAIGNLYGDAKPDFVFTEGNPADPGSASTKRLFGYADFVETTNPSYTPRPLPYVSGRTFQFSGNMLRLIDREGTGGMSNDLEISGIVAAECATGPVHRNVLDDISFDAGQDKVVVGAGDAGSVVALPDFFKIGDFTGTYGGNPGISFVGVQSSDETPGQYYCGVIKPIVPHLALFQMTPKTILGDYDGQPNQIIETNSDGKKRITVPEPAYFPSVSGSSAASAAMLAKHMLTQIGRTRVYQNEVDQDNANAVSANGTGWKLHTDGRCLPYYNQVWNEKMNSQGLAVSPYAYDASPLVVTQYFTQYSPFSQVLESSAPGNGNTRVYSTTIYDENSIFPIAGVSNGRYGECLAMDFEELTNADIPTARYGSGTVFDMATTSPHAGSKCLKIYKGTASDPYVLTWDTPDNTDLPTSGSRKIRWEFWAKGDDAGEPLQAQTFIQTSGDDAWHGAQTFPLSTSWQKHSFETDVPYGMLFHITLRPAMNMAGSYIERTPPTPPVYTYYDDVRAYPAGAMATGMSYDQVLGVPVAVTDANNNTRKTEYDGFGRVTATYDTRGVKTRDNSYFLMGDTRRGLSALTATPWPTPLSVILSWKGGDYIPDRNVTYTITIIRNSPSVYHWTRTITTPGSVIDNNTVVTPTAGEASFAHGDVCVWTVTADNGVNPPISVLAEYAFTLP